MFCRLAPVWAVLLLTLVGPSVRAQAPFATNLVPSRTTLAHVGLEREWIAVVPIVGTERVLRISRSADLFFVQTNHGSLHVYDVHSGQHLWSASLGQATPRALPVSSNSFGVYGTASDVLVALDRATGRTVWKKSMGVIPSCGTACDEDRVMVGTQPGKVYAYKLREKGPKGDMKILTKPVEAWNWQTSGPIHTLPLPAEHVTALGSEDGRVYVVLNTERTPLYRVRTGGPIGDGLGKYGTRTLLIPSADYNLYAVDVLTSNSLWTFPSGGPIDQSPVVAGEDIYTINHAGYLTLLDPATGTPRWTTLTLGGKLVSVSATKIYLRSWNDDLYVIDRATGRILADPAATASRAGLNLRPYTLAMLNRYDDRLYFGTDSGMVIALRELGATQPTLLRDPKALPFGYIPPEGVKLTPVSGPVGDKSKQPAEDADAKDKENAPGEDAAKPAEPEMGAPPPDADAPKAATPKAARPKRARGAGTPKDAGSDGPG